MPLGLDKLKHIVVLMMENRSFDHMLGALKATDPRIDGLDGTQFNPDTTGARGAGAAAAPSIRASSIPIPTIISPASTCRSSTATRRPTASPTMQGFVKSYFAQRQGREALAQDHVLLHAGQAAGADDARDASSRSSTAGSRPFPARRSATARSPTTARRSATSAWRSSTPNAKFKSIYQRLESAGKTAKIYYFDTKSSSLEVVNLLQHQPQFFGTFQQFLDDCGDGMLPDYSFIEPNYSDHEGDGGADPRVGSASRIITCRKASGSSPRSTTRSGRTPRCGSRPRC